MLLRALLFLSAVVLYIGLLIHAAPQEDSSESVVFHYTSASFRTLLDTPNYLTLIHYYTPSQSSLSTTRREFTEAAKSLAGFLPLAEVNCQEEKLLCKEQGIDVDEDAEPQLRFYSAGSSKSGSLTGSSYTGALTAKSLISFCLQQLRNPSIIVDDINFSTHSRAALKNGLRASILLFTDKKSTPSIFKALAMTYEQDFSFFEVRTVKKGNEELIQQYGVEKFPTMIFQAGGEEGSKRVYNGEESTDVRSMKKWIAEQARQLLSDDDGEWMQKTPSLFPQRSEKVQTEKKKEQPNKQQQTTAQATPAAPSRPSNAPSDVSSSVSDAGEVVQLSSSTITTLTFSHQAWMLLFCSSAEKTCPLYETAHASAARTLKNQVRFGYIDTQKEAQLAQQYGVKNVPTLLTYNTGVQKIATNTQKYDLPTEVVESYDPHRIELSLIDRAWRLIDSALVKPITSQAFEQWIEGGNTKSSTRPFLHIVFFSFSTQDIPSYLSALSYAHRSTVTIGATTHTEAELVQKFGVAQVPSLYFFETPAKGESDNIVPVRYPGLLTYNHLDAYCKEWIEKLKSVSGGTIQHQQSQAAATAASDDDSSPPVATTRATSSHKTHDEL